MDQSGFMCVAQHVMKRVKVTDKKFQHQNLNRIDEAVRNVSMAYGLAAVQEFVTSESFPTTNETLDEHKQKHGNHHDLLLKLSKDWIERHSSTIVSW